MPEVVPSRWATQALERHSGWHSGRDLPMVRPLAKKVPFFFIKIRARQ
jgi:hypothetical protein